MGGKDDEVGTPSADPEWRVDCNSLAEIRREIDRLDARIAPLLSQRLWFVRQAARFKPSKEAVVVRSREDEIFRSVRAMAERYGANPDVIEHVYRAIIEGFTAEEKKNWDNLHHT